MSSLLSLILISVAEKICFGYSKSSLKMDFYVE